MWEFVKAIEEAKKGFFSFLGPHVGYPTNGTSLAFFKEQIQACYPHSFLDGMLLK